MQYNKLGHSGLMVSNVCLGTMTFGIQNTQEDANQQLDFALAKGINIIDTAELYPVPPSAPTHAKTEQIIGNWIAAHPSQRQDLVVMTKIAGNGLPYIRGGSDITGQAVEAAIDASLARLQTDYIDVYQLHWPNRTSPHFAKHWTGKTDPTSVDVEAEIQGMRDILSGIQKALSAGKIRYWGLSDDTPWGIMTYLKLCAEMGIPKPVSIQNEFSLLHLKDWPYLIETCAFEDIAYMPWSPLASGMLTGKYLHGNMPKGSRWTLVQRNGLFRNTDQAHAATAEYVAIAQQSGLTPAQLALAWVAQVAGVTTTIIGSTGLTQLEDCISAFDVCLSADTLAQVQAVIQRHPAPY